MREIKVRIEGTAPLLQHKMSVEQEIALEAGATKKRGGEAKGDKPEEYLYTYNGVICQPAEHIIQAMLKKASQYVIKGKGKKTYKELAQGSINIVPEYIPHNNQEWSKDSRTVVIPATRGRTVRVRPRFDNWSLDFTLQLINDDMPIAIVKGMLDDAGREGGIGDYRPRFGRFIVTSFQEVA